jgi:IMP dehydrogenase/GMP reductase
LRVDFGTDSEITVYNWQGEQHMAIRNRLTQIFDIEHPILLAPMDLVSGERLAAAVSHAGGLGLRGQWSPRHVADSHK